MPQNYLIHLQWIQSCPLQGTLYDRNRQIIRIQRFQAAAKGTNCRAAGFYNYYVLHGFPPKYAR